MLAKTDLTSPQNDGKSQTAEKLKQGRNWDKEEKTSPLKTSEKLALERT